ncbi:MAG TPA: hypothetical protein VIH20_05450 [Candidatus Subteraquimicrobiales bacterium]
MKKTDKKKDKSEEKGGFYHHHTLEALKEYRALPPRLKLEWLEESSRFFYKATPKKYQKFWGKFKRGEI